MAVGLSISDGTSQKQTGSSGDKHWKSGLFGALDFKGVIRTPPEGYFIKVKK